MKVIDKTPFFTETGEISVIDRGKAMMKFGAAWFKEIEAQKQVMAVFSKTLDKNYTLLRNVTPPGLATSIPFILVGPTGVYVMYVTSLTGMFRAKGEQWGSLNGNDFIPEKVNLLTRTERMARAVQVYIQRQGFNEISSVEPILLCADSSANVDSVRPIIRVVMRDALDRLAISISQQQVFFGADTVQKIVNRILEAPKPQEPAPEAASQPEPEAPEPAAEEVYNPYTQAFETPNNIFNEAPTQPPPADFFQAPPEERPSAAADRSKVRNRVRFSKKQIIFLVAMFIIWCLIIAGFIFLVVQDTLL